MLDYEKEIFKKELKEKIIILADMLGMTPDIMYEAIKNWIIEGSKPK